MKKRNQLPQLSIESLDVTQLSRLFLSKYTLEYGIGAGSSSVVMQGRSIETRDPVVIKFILKERIPVWNWRRDRALGTIPLEAFFLKRLCHKNIVAFVDLFEDAKFVYLVMESNLESAPFAVFPPSPTMSPTDSPVSFVSGDTKDFEAHFGEKVCAEPTDTLASPPSTVNETNSNCGTAMTRSLSYTVIETHEASPVSLGGQEEDQATKKRRRSRDLYDVMGAYISEQELRHIFQQTASAVEYLHSLGIVHRDIKTENILTDESLNIKLIDFGNAQTIPLRKEDWFTSFHGTWNSAAPEIIRGEPYRGPEADIWALGVLLFSLCYQRIPFASPEAILLGTLPQVPNDRSLELVALIHRLLDPDWRSRPSIHQVLADPWLSSQSSSVTL